MKGTAAKAQMTTQDRAVSKKAWRTFSAIRSMRLASMNWTPKNSVRAQAMAKTIQSGLPAARSTDIGSSIATARTLRSAPMMKKTGRVSKPVMHRP